MELNMSNHRVKQADNRESTDIKQLISMNSFYAIGVFIVIREFFIFP